MKLRVAWPELLRFTGGCWVVESTTKVTVPVVGALPPGEVTLAVKVTAWPMTDGFAEELIAVAVPAWPTVKGTATDWLLAAKLLPPL